MLKIRNDFDVLASEVLDGMSERSRRGFLAAMCNGRNVCAVHMDTGGNEIFAAGRLMNHVLCEVSKLENKIKSTETEEVAKLRLLNLCVQVRNRAQSIAAARDEHQALRFARVANRFVDTLHGHLKDDG